MTLSIKFGVACVFALVFLINVATSARYDVYKNLDKVVEDLQNEPGFEKEWEEHMAKMERNAGVAGIGSFPCEVVQSDPKPTSVHELRPADIDVVAALGDSISACNGGKARGLVGVALNYRGLTFSVGGDNSLHEEITIPNILKMFNPNIKGYSVGIGGWDTAASNLNMAVPGAESWEMPEQARRLVAKMRAGWGGVDIDNDWKLLTIFIGGNDHCGYCKDHWSAETFAANIGQALDFLKIASPRTIVNLIAAIDTTLIQALETDRICDIMHYQLCECALTTGDKLNEMKQVYKEYNIELQKMINSGKYDDKDDFTVVYQPFMEDIAVPTSPDGHVDMSYLAPDCFHFGYKGHQMSALALWNNMLEPVGRKTKATWTQGKLSCPTEEHPFIFTSQNSL